MLREYKYAEDLSLVVVAVCNSSRDAQYFCFFVFRYSSSSLSARSTRSAAEQHREHGELPRYLDNCIWDDRKGSGGGRDDCSISDRIILACDAGRAKRIVRYIYLISLSLLSLLLLLQTANYASAGAVHLENEAPITRDFQGRSQYFFIRGVYKGCLRRECTLLIFLILVLDFFFFSSREREIASRECGTVRFEYWLIYVYTCGFRGRERE